MATGNDVIEETLRLFLGSQREELNKLAATASVGATTLTFAYELQGIVPGSQVNVDLETYRVWSVDLPSKTATVQSAMAGTTSAMHTIDTLVYVNPKLSRFAIFKALNNELQSLSSQAHGLFQMKTVEFTYGGVVTDYDLAADVLEVYDVRASLPGPEGSWYSLPNWQHKPSADITAFPSGNAIHVRGGFPGRNIQVLYKAPFVALTNASDDLLTIGKVPAVMQDIISLGVILRLGPAREIMRNFTEAEGDARRMEEVPASAVNKSFDSIRQLRMQRITEEATRLANRYPMRHR